MSRVDPDSLLATDLATLKVLSIYYAKETVLMHTKHDILMANLKEREGKDHILLSFMFKVLFEHNHIDCACTVRSRRLE